MKKILSTLLLTTSVSAVAETAPKNIIMVVGDGMGPAYTAAYRNFKDDPATPEVEATIFDRLLVGRSTTYPHQSSGFVTDSAASATALATGIKTYNGAIGVDINKQPHLTVMEQAKRQGMSTGVVVTSQINHATPASYLSHVEGRRMYNEIADSYFDVKLDGQFKADIMLGGGWEYFIRDDRDLTKEFVQAGYAYTDSYQQLAELNGEQILGLFGDTGLPWALDSQQPERLKYMSQIAIDKLDNNDKGFLMLIEGSQVDWAGHSNDIAAAMAEMDDLAKTLEWLETYVQQHPDTLVVITADHNTGGMSIGRDGKYAWQPEYIQNLSMSPESLAKKLLSTNFDAQVINSALGFEITKDERTNLVAAYKRSNKAIAAAKQDKNADARKYKNGQRALYVALKQLIDLRTNTGWTTGGHTGVDVPVFAMGMSSDQFRGQIDNTDIAKKIFALLEQMKSEQMKK